MKVLNDEQFAAPCALLLGGFDGLHEGHASLLAEAKKTGLPVGLTSISGGKAGGDIFTFRERERIFEAAGCAFVWEIPFTEVFKNTEAEAFLRAVFGKINVAALFCGEDFRFGKGARGDAALLRAVSPCPVYALPVRRDRDEKIATSRLKALLAEGDLPSVNRFLVCDYFLEGVVEHGRRVGRTLGFPTVNLAEPREKFPLREGVYAGVTEAKGKRYPSVVNFGSRPTFGVSERKAEAYLEGFDGDLYGEEIRIYPKEFLRPVVKFQSRDELISQLERDKKSLRERKL